MANNSNHWKNFDIHALYFAIMPNFTPLKDHFRESSLYLSRTIAAGVIVGLMFMALIGRLIYLQILKNDLYSTLSFNNQVRVVPIQPKRGLIFDRHGILLAENAPAFSLELTPERTPNIQETLKKLRPVIGLTETEEKNFKKQLKYKRRYEAIPIRVKLSEEDLAKFSLEKHQFPGVEVAARLIRYYPLGDAVAHVLGYIAPISEKDLETIDEGNYRGTYHIGKTGVEKFYEKELHGKVGYQHVETNAHGRTIRVTQRIAPIPGKDLVLTLDSRLQHAASQALGQLKGAIVVIDVKTGGILALISKPSFDPNLFTQGIDVANYKALKDAPERPLFNRAIIGQYPPGSTIKPVEGIQGLETGITTIQYSMFDPGWYQLHGTGRLYRDMIYHSKRHGHGWVDLEKAIQYSCDTYFFSLAFKLGADNLHNIFTRFGLGKPTGIDYSGESSGLAPSPEWKRKVRNQPWYGGDTLNIGIGQGMMMATPLQIAQMANILAGRGRYYKPHLLEGRLEEGTPVVLKSEKTWDFIIEAMRKVVHVPGGTAYRISPGLSIEVAGKTGTAQVFNLKQNEKYEAHKVKETLRDHSWFIAFAPVQDPQIALAVIVENKYKIGGADVARKVLDSIFKENKPYVTPGT